MNIIISGITGQDGAYLSEYLLSKNHKVIGIGRFTDENKLWRIKKLNIQMDIEFVETDLEDSSAIEKVIKKYEPDEIYNLAAQSSVSSSWNIPFQCIEFNTKSILCLVNALKNMNSDIKLFHASSSEIFGLADTNIQSEDTKFNAVSPYGLSKLFGQKIIENYRNNYNLYLYSGILFAHESPLRDIKFVSKKIVHYFAKLVKYGYTKPLELGNLSTKRDWGWAPDYVKAMPAILRKKPDDYIIASGTSYTVQDFVVNIAKFCNIKLIWEGTGIDTKAYDNNGRTLIKINSQFFRPIEAKYLQGNITKIKNLIGWQPNYTFDDICELMIKEEIKDLENETHN